MRQMDTTTRCSRWDSFASHLVARLSPDDDPSLWQIAIETVIGDAESLCRECAAKRPVVAQIGRCSHWWAPNKARWLTEDGEFTWPSGYLPKSGFWGGLPEFDWYLFWQYHRENGTWRQTPKMVAKRPLLRRVAIPARTGLHLRASVQAIWTPGPAPEFSPARLFYGFRKAESLWECKARKTFYREAGLTKGCS